MKKVLSLPFFDRPALEVAPDLLGKFLVTHKDGKEIALMICEVEAYVGEHDLACHARVGKTERTAPLFGPPGHFYVYFIYGIHWMLNIVTDRDGYASGVLIRGAGEFIGPARLTKFLKIDRCLKGKPAVLESGVWFEDRDIKIPEIDRAQTARIGVGYAGEWAQKPYRFIIKSIVKK